MTKRRLLTGSFAITLAACGGDPYGRGAADPVVIAVDHPMMVADDAPGPMEARATKDMVRVRAGLFPRGCSTRDAMCFDNERPLRGIDLPAFDIDRTEVTVAAYRKCVVAGACSDEGLGTHTTSRNTWHAPSAGHNTTHFETPIESPTCNWSAPGRGQYPINCVTWDQAHAFCGWAGKRLPTEAEWEKAARGADERIYPWGDAPPSCDVTVMDEGGLGCGTHNTAAVGSRPRGKSPTGALDMIGNVTEWVNDWYQVDYYASSSDVNPKGPSVGQYRVVRGGTWKNRIEGGVNGLRISNRYSYVPYARLDYVGFRCARDAR